MRNAAASAVLPAEGFTRNGRGPPGSIFRILPFIRCKPLGHGRRIPESLPRVDPKRNLKRVEVVGRLAYFSRRLNISSGVNALQTAEQAYGPKLMNKREGLLFENDSR